MNELSTLAATTLAQYARSIPDANPVDRYLASLNSEASRTTMLQALGVCVQLIDGNDRPQTTQGQTRNDRKASAEALRQGAREFNWFEFTDEAAERFLARLATQNYAKSSQNKMLAAMLGVLKQCGVLLRRHARETIRAVVDAGGASGDTLVALQAVENARLGALVGATDVLAEYKPTVITDDDDDEAAEAAAEKERALTDDEVEALAIACTKRGVIGARDMAILALGIGGGLRRSEIAALRFDDVTWKDQFTAKGKPYLEIRVRHGKGNKERQVLLMNGSREALLQWRRIRGDAKGPLLYSFRKGQGAQVGQPIDPQTVYNVCDELAAAAGIEAFAPHDMRRTMVSNMIDATGDIAMASKCAGHASIETTKRYDKRGKKKQAEAVDTSAHFPFMSVTVQAEIEASIA